MIKRLIYRNNSPLKMGFFFASEIVIVAVLRRKQMGKISFTETKNVYNKKRLLVKILFWNDNFMHTITIEICL